MIFWRCVCARLLRLVDPIPSTSPHTHTFLKKYTNGLLTFVDFLYTFVTFVYYFEKWVSVRWTSFNSKLETVLNWAKFKTQRRCHSFSWLTIRDRYDTVTNHGSSFEPRLTHRKMNHVSPSVSGQVEFIPMHQNV